MSKNQNIKDFWVSCKAARPIISQMVSQLTYTNVGFRDMTQN